MASVLDFERYSSDLNRQLLRRIGYTNGLHKIRRFARVVEYLYPIMPSSMTMLVQIIMQEENVRATDTSDRPLKGKKYAQGIVDVAQALLLLEKFGPKIALSSQGYACHALNRSDQIAPIEAFLMEKVIECDGEYLLNVLRLVSEGMKDAVEIGRELSQRFLSLIQFKMKWVESTIEDRFSQRSVGLVLAEADKVFRKAIQKDAVEFFYKHTVNPRIEWLTDLGYLDGALGLTTAGNRLLQNVRELGGWTTEFIFLPLDNWLTSQLSLPNLVDATMAQDMWWRLVAGSKTPAPVIFSQIEVGELLSEIRVMYPDVKLMNFNEADALSVYEVLASRAAVEGRVLPEQEFTRVVKQLVEEFPGEIFKLSKRRGRGLYIALKTSA
jgi:hypothetical protein